MQCIVLVGFLPDDNGHNCDFHLFGCGNALILNCDDQGGGIHLCLHMTVEHKLAFHTINSVGSDGCCICFTTREYTAGDNGQLLDGAVMKITAIFAPDHENPSMRHLYHYSHGCAYAVAESIKTNNQINHIFILNVQSHLYFKHSTKQMHITLVFAFFKTIHTQFSSMQSSQF